MRVYLSGALVEDVEFYGRNHQLCRRLLMPSDWIVNDAVGSGMQSYAEGAPNSVQPTITNQLLAPGKSCMFSLTPLLGLLTCGKMLSLRYGGLSIELTFSDAIDSVTAGSSTSYEIQECSIRCAVSKLDGALEASYASLLMQNRALTIKVTTYHSQQQTLPAGSSELNVSLARTFSRLIKCPVYNLSRKLSCRHSASEQA